MTDSTPAPYLGELLKDSPSNWGKWGPDDEVGSLNYLGPEQVLAAVRLVRSGKVFTLQRLIGDPKGDPVWPGRTPAERTQILDESNWDEGGDGPAYPGGLHYADDKINAFLQGSTQYDALGHVWYDGKIWNGYDARTTIGGMDKASVEPIAQRGVVGRGRAARHGPLPRQGQPRQGRDVHPRGPAWPAPRRRASTIEKRDILIIRTNFLQLFYDQGEAFYEGFNEPGLVYSPELVQWFADMEIPNLVTDTIANEVTFDPNNGVALVLHNALMRNLGRHAHRDRRPREARGRLRRGRPVRRSCTSRRRSRSPRAAARPSTLSHQVRTA